MRTSVTARNGIPPQGPDGEARYRLGLFTGAAWDFAKALLVGVLLSAPFSLALADFSHSVRLTFYSKPEQHAALESWYREQPLVRDLEVRPDTEGVLIRYSARGMFTDPGLPPLQGRPIPGSAGSSPRAGPGRPPRGEPPRGR